MKRRVLPILLLGSAALACSLFPPPRPSGESTPTVPTLPPPLPPLTVDQLRNAEYQLMATVNGIHVVRLQDGTYQKGSNPAAADYTSVTLAPQMAFGDLNGDGSPDAAVLLAENYGGTGVFVSVVVMINQDGQPVSWGASMLDDRPVINSLSIHDGEVLLDAIVHGPDDPGCCAAQPTTRTLRATDLGLVLTGLTTTTADGRARSITISSPADGSEASGTVRVTGSVTIAPFENNLSYHIVDPAGGELAAGPIAVQAAVLGGPGTFDVVVGLSALPAGREIYLEIQDDSPADGSLLAMASVALNIR